MRRFCEIAKMGFMLQIVYRWHVVLTALGNLVYLVMIYYLWKAIFSGGHGTLHGATFHQTFLQLACASSMFVLFRNYLEWFISRDVLTGNILVRLIKPLDHQAMCIAQSTGAMLFNLILTTLPTLIILFCLFTDGRAPSAARLALFAPSLVIAFLINALVDYSIGCVSFYTESIWGISTAKEAVVLFLSGAMIPLAFFPETLRTVIECLPFQAIYALPLSIVFADAPVSAKASTLLLQAFWLCVMVAASRLLFMRASRAVTVNGG